MFHKLTISSKHALGPGPWAQAQGPGPRWWGGEMSGLGCGAAWAQARAQTLGPEALMKFIDASEAIKRLAAAQGIDVLNLVKTPQQMQQEMQQDQAMAAQQSLVNQTGQIAGTPLMDPEKNPELAEQATTLIQGLQQNPPE